MTASTPAASALTTTPTDTSSSNKSGGALGFLVGGYGILVTILSSIVLIAFHVGAAKLSYDKYGSIGWAILDFFFATVYYPYYAFVLNYPGVGSATFLGGRRRR
jgi:hypothetical protein